MRISLAGYRLLGFVQVEVGFGLVAKLVVTQGDKQLDETGSLRPVYWSGCAAL